ncbi:hypothetical protein [Halomarina rubra]|uniref:Uncharacterized protein n=1 Tax=Halomarina rubra TaxID=2071873 RepID=A0ABD6ARG4_9EURY|nr:hypothetical protein [Halomarina rubra]
MRSELRERREKTWDLLVVKGLDYGDVVERLATQYDVTASAIESDIHRMDDWLPKLDAGSTSSGLSRLRELRQNRQRYQQLAVEARREGDIDQELRVRRRIDQAIDLDVSLAQSLGLTVREPEEVTVAVDEDVDELRREIRSAIEYQEAS